jgi:hypothetical protein
MKITIEFEPGELVKGLTQSVTAAMGQAGGAHAPPPTEPHIAAAPYIAAAPASADAIDAGAGPGGVASGVPAEVAAQAAMIGAISAGAAPDLG